MNIREIITTKVNKETGEEFVNTKSFMFVGKTKTRTFLVLSWKEPIAVILSMDTMLMKKRLKLGLQ